MATYIQESEIPTSNPDRESANNENPTVNPNSTDQSNNISQDQVMQAIIAESAKQTAESAKQI